MLKKLLLTILFFACATTASHALVLDLKYCASPENNSIPEEVCFELIFDAKAKTLISSKTVAGHYTWKNHKMQYVGTTDKPTSWSSTFIYGDRYNPAYAIEMFFDNDGTEAENLEDFKIKFWLEATYPVPYDFILTEGKVLKR